MQSSIQRSSALLGTLRARPRPCSFFSNQHNFRRNPRNVRSFSSSPHAAATHQETPSSSLLSQALDQRRRAAGNARADTAGPFVLGVTQQPYDQTKVKKWSELTTKGKGEYDLIMLYGSTLKMTFSIISHSVHSTNVECNCDTLGGWSYSCFDLCTCLGALRTQLTNCLIRRGMLTDY